MDRRRALQVLGALAAFPALPGVQGLSASELLALGSRVHGSLDEEMSGAAPRALGPAQYRAVATAAEHILPRTRTPGATDARVADFIDVMLADWYPTAERDRFVGGLAELDVRAKRAYGRAFVQGSGDQRIAVLTILDGEVSGLRQTNPRAAGEHWFGILKYLTVWGYYTSRVGITQELKVQLMPGYYDGDAPYHAS
jgi:hypothetical protein